MIQHPYFILILVLVAHTLYILVYVLFIYLYYAYFILVYYTSIVYYTLIKNIYDSNLHFTLALFPPHSTSLLFKTSRALVDLELRAC